ncbi:phospholipase D family protein [Ideonella sp. BN130291]|uniref:phospholipase D family protein n=1 Tax=Ideonella sp. BN130291 TaxID=3112940 RepID=UPI002E2604B1|nr:phospholipase D family protein [Ideonella sp. BN130291]
MRLITRLFLLALLLATMVGCASLPDDVQRTPSHTLVAPATAPLSQVAADARIPDDKSGFWPMPASNFALDARLTLIRQARSSLDLQTYLIGNDTIGRLILRELRDAAARGVRVRVLVDDLYTQGLDPLLLGLAAHDNVEVRLFNPFASGRDWSLGRFWGFATDFRRLNHRMHNKLFIADGAMAIVGGRNLADEYFFRSRDANFLDMELLIAGALVPKLGVFFDSYWNSEQVFPLHSIVRSLQPRLALQDDFEDRTSGPTDPATLPPAGKDSYGAPAFSTALHTHQHHFVIAEAGAHADAPDKGRAVADAGQKPDTVTVRFMGFMGEAKEETLLFSPYFIPGREGLKRMKAVRDRGVKVRVVTNAMGTSDEPLVNLGYERYRREMLGMGVQLYEISSSRLTRDATLKSVLGSSRGRLHAKMAFIDRRLVLVGSMNLDPRSTYTNTEIGIGIRSPELAKMILDVYRADDFNGVYQVQLKPDGSGVQWVGRDKDGEEVLLDEPDIGPWQRFKLWLLYKFVPEDLL